MNFKDSNIDWVSEIPSNWSVKKLKYILHERIEKNNPIKTTNVLSLTAVQGVVPYSEKKASGGNKQKDDLSAYKLAYPNDIVLNSMNIVTGSVGLSNYYGCVSPVYYMFYTDDENININYYNYIFKSKIFQKRLIGFGNGILQMTSEAGNLYAVRMKIPIDKFKSLMLPVPPIEDQNAIVEYLNNKTEWIDKIIEKSKCLLQLLEEKRISLINKVITKGLNLSVQMKDSKVEWIGKIPEHWNMMKISNIYNNIGSGTTPSSSNEEYYIDGTVNWLITGDLNDGYINQTSTQINIKALHDISTLKIYPKNSLVIAMYGATIGKLGILNIDACTNQACCVLSKTNSADNKFIYYWFLGFRKDIVSLSYGGGQPNISQDIIKNLKIPIPPLNEQKQIINYLDLEITKIINTINKIQENIDLLEEYKTSLIHHAVTGKIYLSSD